MDQKGAGRAHHRRRPGRVPAPVAGRFADRRRLYLKSQAFFAAVDALRDEDRPLERPGVLIAMARGRMIGPTTVLHVVESPGLIVPERQRADVLVALAGRQVVAGAARGAFTRAVARMRSAVERERVLNALERSRVGLGGGLGGRDRSPRVDR